MMLNMTMHEYNSFLIGTFPETYMIFTLKINDSCLQFWGGMGFTNDVGISRSYRFLQQQSCQSCYCNHISIIFIITDLNVNITFILLMMLIIAIVFRDGRLGSIAGGADEVMLGILCKGMGILPKKKQASAMGILPKKKQRGQSSVVAHDYVKGS